MLWDGTPSPPHVLQIYSQTDGSYMGSPEMSPLYSIVNALTQTATAIISILTSLLAPSALHSPVFFLPVCRLPWINLSSSLSVSQHPILFLSRTEQMPPPSPPHTHANILSLESNSGTLKHLRSPLFFAFFIMHIILFLLLSCTK